MLWSFQFFYDNSIQIRFKPTQETKMAGNLVSYEKKNCLNCCTQTLAIECDFGESHYPQGLIMKPSTATRE